MFFTSGFLFSLRRASETENVIKDSELLETLIQSVYINCQLLNSITFLPGSLPIAVRQAAEESIVTASMMLAPRFMEDYLSRC